MIASWVLQGVLALAASAPSLDACQSKRVDDPEHWSGYTCYYVYARKTGDYAGALSRIRALVDAEPDRTWARYILADLLLDSGLDGASALYREVSAEFAEQGDYKHASLSRVAYAFTLEGQDTIAAELVAAAELADLAGDPKLVAQVRVQQVRLMLRYGGPLGQAAELLAEARAASFPDGAYEHKKYVLYLESDLAQLQDQPGEAYEKLQALRALAEAHDDRYVATSVEVGMLSLQVESPELRTGELSDLADRLTQVDAAALEDNPYARSQYLCLHGDLAEDRATARQHYEACVALAVDIGADGAERSALHGLGLLDGNEEQLFQASDRARALGRTGLFSQQLVSRSRFVRGNRDGGAEAAFELFDAIDRIAVRQGDPLMRAQLLSSMTPYYDEAASWLLGDEFGGTPERLELALRAVERLRARTIADALEQARVESSAVHDPELVALGRRITEINNQLRFELEDDARAALLRELDGLERGEAALYDRWVGEQPPREVVSTHLSLSEIQRTLTPGQAVLSYQLARPPYAVRWETVPVRSWVAVITASSVSVHELPALEEIEPVVELYVGAIRNPEISGPLANRLHRELVAAPLRDVPPEVDQLIVIPDGALHRIPFAALAERGGPSLGQRFAISRAPSLAIWQRLRQADNPSGASAIALVEPEIEDPRLDPLTSAHREGEALAAVVSTELRQGADASEAFFAVAGLQGVSVVHFGAHAVVDDRHPERAAVVLAPGSPEHDGLLQPRELAARQFDDALVVLASCRSAGGPIVAEEGPMGLAHALFRGGARTVVASLWPLEDTAASAFFTRFYEVLGQGETVANAVAVTRRDLSAQGFGPEIWAGVVVLGDGDFVPLDPQPLDMRWLGWALLAALGLGASVLVLRPLVSRGRATKRV